MTDFFSCDWGTTSFRLRRVNAETGCVLRERTEPCGVRMLSSTCLQGDAASREKTFANFLRAQLRLLAGHGADLDGTSVMVSGMASSSVGWRELPYARVPLDLEGSSLVEESFDLTVDDGWRARIHLISGVRTDTDMMRGEETEILGIFSDGRHAQIAEHGIVLLPGTHSKHVRVQQRQLIGFQTYMTGELFDVLSAHSLLRSSVQAPERSLTATLSEPASREAFVAGVRGASETGLAGSLFQTRVRTVLQRVSPAVNGWFLSGLLIGSETVALSARESDEPILLAAPEPLSAAYRLALETLGLRERLTVVSAEEMAFASIRGHRTLLRRHREKDRNPLAE